MTGRPLSSFVADVPWFLLFTLSFCSLAPFPHNPFSLSILFLSLFVLLYFNRCRYDAFKSNSATVSHLRFGPHPITSEYNIDAGQSASQSDTQASSSFSSVTHFFFFFLVVVIFLASSLFYSHLVGVLLLSSLSSLFASITAEYKQHRCRSVSHSDKLPFSLHHHLLAFSVSSVLISSLFFACFFVLADYVACHHFAWLHKYDVLRDIKEGGVFVLNTAFKPHELEKELPAKIKRQLAQKKVSLPDLPTHCSSSSSSSSSYSLELSFSVSVLLAVAHYICSSLFSLSLF